MMPEFNADLVWKLLASAENDVNVFMAVPTIYAKLVEGFRRTFGGEDERGKREREATAPDPNATYSPPLAFSVLQLEHLGGDGQVSQAGTPPGLAPLSHSWTVALLPSPCRADPQDPLPILWLCP